MKGTAKKFLMRQLALAVMTLAGRVVGFDLSRPLRQQAQGSFDGLGQLFFNVAQMLFGVREDHFQTRVLREIQFAEHTARVCAVVQVRRRDRHGHQ